MYYGIMFLSEILTCICSFVIILFVFTIANFYDVNQGLITGLSTSISDRNGHFLGFSEQGKWNLNPVDLDDYFMLKKAIIFSEDSGFYNHSGVDWPARISAAFSNLKEGRVVRGASTISEQVVKMFHKRKRNIWSRWMEGIQAQFSLERNFTKTHILNFYLNQVPFADNIRGVSDAAFYYFGRNLDSLSLGENLALAVMIRSPNGLRLKKNPDKLKTKVLHLARKMLAKGEISGSEFKKLKMHPFTGEGCCKKKNKIDLSFYHFVEYVRKKKLKITDGNIVQTTLDATLQKKVESILRGRLNKLKKYNVHNAAALVMDAKTGEIYAWVSVGDKSEFIDSVLVHRQAASVMKPFLYAASFEKGATKDTSVEDLPISESNNSGLHIFRNYSGLFYKKSTIQLALGNSLNIPAIHTLDFVTPKRYLSYLKDLGFFQGVDFDVSIYGYGLGLGVAEVSLYELVQAYSVFSNAGFYKRAHVLSGDISTETEVFSKSSIEMINDILLNPMSRIMEFGLDSVLNFASKTSVKTGTSGDYRDAWAIGFERNYIVGVWVGNSDYSRMEGVTGSIGAAFPLRSIFFELSKTKHYRSWKHKSNKISSEKKSSDVNEYKKVDFIPSAKLETSKIEMAIDPRIPRKYQIFEFHYPHKVSLMIEWFCDGKSVESSKNGVYKWKLQEGTHTIEGVPLANSNYLPFKVKVFVR